MVRRDHETGEARHERVTVDATKALDFCLRLAYIDFYWAPDPNAPAHLAAVPPRHLGVWRRGLWTHANASFAIGGARDGHNSPRSPRLDFWRSPRRVRSRSISPPRAVEAIWPTRASSSAAFSLFGSARVRDVPVRAPRGAAVSAVAHAWVEQLTGLRRAVERADGRRVESALAIIGKAVAHAVDGNANYESFSPHLEAVQQEEAVALTRFKAESVLGRHAHANGRPSGGAPLSARNTRARRVSQESGASVGSRLIHRRDSRRSDEDEEEKGSLLSELLG